MISRVSDGDSFGYSSTAERRPRTRTVGWAPADRCRSDARRETTSISRSAKSMSIVRPIDPRGAGLAADWLAVDKGWSRAGKTHAPRRRPRPRESHRRVALRARGVSHDL